MKVQRNGRSFTVEVSADGEGLVSHAGSALLVRSRLGTELRNRTRDVPPTH